MPRFSEAVSAVPRAAVISLITGMNEATGEQVAQAEAALQIMQDSANNNIRPELMEKLNSAFESGKFVEQVDEMMTDEDFANMIFSIRPPELDNAN